MTLEQMKSEILEHWEEYYPQTFRKQDKAWLDRQAEAWARMCLQEMRPLIMTGQSAAEAWSEVAGAMLTKCPTQAPKE